MACGKDRLMPQFMVWQMAGPMASWGRIAVGEKRYSDSEPTRSALIGLLAACLGIPHGDEDNLMALSSTLGVASAVLSDPSSQLETGPLRDFHTIQTAKPRRKGQVNVSRSDELTDPGSTILSERFYLMGGMFLGCVWLRPHPLVTLPALVEAMNQPVFSPYLGRRCCPAGLPFSPKIIDVTGCDAAMMGYLDDENAAKLFGGKPNIARMSWDMDVPGDRLRTDQRVRRRDLTVSFQRRQFVERDEEMAFVSNNPVPAVDEIPSEGDMFNAIPEQG